MKPAQNNIEESACKVTDEICLPDSKLSRVVIIGGGFAGLALVEELKHRDVQAVLFHKNNFLQFEPLLYQVATSTLKLESIVFPFRKQIRGYKNVLFRLAEVKEIEPSSNTVITNKGRVRYDYLITISGFRNKILVGLAWVVSSFNYAKSYRLIIRNFKHRFFANVPNESTNKKEVLPKPMINV